MPVPLYSLDRPLGDGDVASYRAAFDELQGNILKGHGRNETASVFVTFRSTAGARAGARAFVHRMVSRVTTAAKQEEQIVRFKKTRRSELFTGLWLSAEGYRYFLRREPSGFELAFREGMRAGRDRLNDPPIGRWEDTFRRPIHALLTLAHNDAAAVAIAADDYRRELEGIASVSWELGHAMREGDRAFEHFGFVDGVSQPIFFQNQLGGAGSTAWDPSAGPNLVVRKDPLGVSDAECGSYFVFRKLEQNVKGFRLRLKELADHVRVDPQMAGALIMGRFADGTPVATSDIMNGRRENGFDYGADPQGHMCPLFSHVRKANPRAPAHRVHRIARRGITYGPPTTRDGDETGLPERGVGILFQCCQASLAAQFENIQVLWANEPNFINAGVGQDAVIGQRNATQVSVPSRWGKSARVNFRFGEFVRMLGGEYFFAPARSVLARL